MALTIVIGALFGDEGKGRVVQALAPRFAVVTRATGGANASHTVIHRGQPLTLRQVPCGVFSRATCCTGDGMVLDPLQLLEELDVLAARGVDTSRVRISERAVVVTPLHRAIDTARSAYTLSDRDDVIGTTQQGVGPALVDKMMRTALRFSQLADTRAIRRSLEATLALFPSVCPTPRALTAMVRRLAWARRALGDRVVDTREVVHAALARGRGVLVEGAQGTLLDIDHGAYPFVTATHPTTAGALASLGVGPRHVERVIGVTRAYVTRQAQGPLFTEIPAADERAFRALTGEHVLRVGWLDAVALRGAARINGFTELLVTNVDGLAGFPAAALATGYLDAAGLVHRTWGRPELAPASIRYVRVRAADLDATARRVGPIHTRAAEAVAAWKPYLLRVAREVGLPIRHVSASAGGPLVPFPAP